MIRLALMLLALALPAAAQERIVAGLSQNRVSITADFDGSEILIYGAVKRDAPAPQGAPLEVIVTVEGPATPVAVRRKGRVAGIWVNNASVNVDSAPTFYAVATTGPLNHILSDTDNLRYGITIERVIRAIGIADEADKAGEFILALLRVRTNEGRYRVLEGKVELTEDTLFRTDVVLPANLTEGEYKVRLFLLRDKRVIASQERVIGVRKEGLERFG
ncbi:MAG: TIGR02186 family protein, partial [Tabrizicola sp.]